MGFSPGRFVRSGAFAALACLGLIVLADWLFHAEPLGWTVSLLGAAVLATLLVRDRRALHSWQGRVALGVVGGLLLAGIEQPTPLVIAMGCLGLVVVASINRQGWTGSAGEWYMRVGTFVGWVWVQVLRDWVIVRTRRLRVGDRPTVSSRALRWAVPLTLQVVFVVLFYAANPLVERWIDSGWAKWMDLLRHLRWARVGLWAGVGLSVWALMRVRRRRRRVNPELANDAARLVEWALSADIVVGSLAVFNVAFAVHNILDAAYLWGGATLPPGVTYAAYAQRGAYPLVVTAILAGIFVLAAFRRGVRLRHPRLARALMLGWVAQNVLLLGSAAWRLDMYVAAYGLTRLRLAAAIWMVLVCTGLVLIVWRITRARTSDWLLGASTLATLGVLYVLCFVNFDGIIASYNVRHCREVGGSGQPIDMAYLDELGPDSIPALRWLSAHSRDPGTAGSAAALESRLTRHLDEILSGWRSWTFHRARLAAQ